MASTHVALVTAGGTSNRRIASSLYGYCQTGASTVAKTVSLYTGNSTTTDGTWAAGDLFHGLTITVRFRYSNTATNPTLNVNSTGAKRIYKYGTTSPGNTASTSWQANSVISLTYDTLLNSSGCWVMNDHLDDTTGGSGSVTYTLSGSGDDDEYTITATPTTGTATSATIPAANQTDAGVMTAADKTKLDGIASGAEVNVQADWNEANSSSDAYIQNKPTIPTVNDATLTIQKNSTTIDTFTANSATNKTVDITVPTATSELNNDSDFVSDASYVHTDNNFTSTLLTKLNGIESGAEVNVQADWDEENSSSDAYIQNKPTIPSATSQLTNDSDFVSDASYVHTDNNFTNTLLTKLNGIESGAEVNVQADWNQTDNTADDYIKNKPTIPAVGTATVTAGTRGSSISSGACHISKDNETGLVIAHFHGQNSSNISTTTTLFTFPAAYRPSSSKNGNIMIVNSSNAVQVGSCTLTTGGVLTQNQSSTTRSFLGMIAYTI